MKGISVSAVLSFILLSSPSEAFRPLGAITTRQSRLFSQISKDANLSRDTAEFPSGRRDFVAHLAGGIGTMWIIGGPPAASAEEIKTLDMSLPTYDSINTLKSSAESEKALGVETPPDAPSKGPSAAPRKKKSSSAGGGGNPLGNVLPSMNKSVGKKSRSSGTATASERPAAAPRRVKEEKAEDEIKTMDLSLPSYSEGIQSKEKSVFSL
jgi:hypothetical protein